MSSSEAVVFFGPTQVGKSTTFNLLVDRAHTGDSPAATGDGSGQSVTAEPTLRQSKIGPLIDTPGMNDSRRRFTNREAGQKIAMQVLAAGVHKIKVVVFEGLGNDSVALTYTLEQLERSLGGEVMKSVVVLAAKADAVVQKSRALRLRTIRAAAEQRGINEVLLWQNEDLDQVDQVRQLADLLAALRRVPATSTKDISDLEQRVRVRAEELCKKAPPRKEVRMTEVEEAYVDVREEPEQYEEEYTGWELRTKMGTERVPVQRTRTVSQPYQEVEEGSQLPQTTGGRVAAVVSFVLLPEIALLAAACGAMGTPSKTVTKFRDVAESYVDYEDRPKEVVEQVPVTKTRQASRTKVVKEEKTRRKSVPVEVCIPRDLQEFMPQAREEVFAEVRAKFQRC